MDVATFVKKHGGRYRSYKGGYLLQCPLGIHKDNNPSFSLSTNGLFNCWSCGTQGNFQRLLHDVCGYSWAKSAQTIQDLGLREDWKDKDNRGQRVVYGQDDVLFKPVDSAVLGLFDVDWEEAYELYQSHGGKSAKHRPPWALVFDKGFLPDTLSHFDAGYDTEDQRITIPVWGDDDQLLGILGRACRQHEFKVVPYFNFKFSRQVYNLYRTEEGQKIILVEGAFDCWMLHQWEIPFTACATMTSHMSEAQAMQILEKHSDICILFDNDEAGWKGTKQAARLLTQHGGRVEVATLFEGEADVKKLGSKGFKKAYSRRRAYPCVLPYEENNSD